MTNTPSDPADLFRRAVIGLDEETEPSDAEPIGWSAISCLHRLGGREVLDRALAACAEPDALRRRVGAAVLGQLGHSKIGFEPVFVEERYQGLVALLRSEREGAQVAAVLAATGFALGHLHDPRAISDLLELRTHPSPEVRWGVVFGLSGYDVLEAIEGLIALSTDEDEDVRDWATFGLGQMVEIDIPALRTALHARLCDPSDKVRGEAIEGLAARGDQSVLPALTRELRDGVSLPLLNAATALARPDLCEALAAAREGGLTVQTAGAQGFDLTDAWTEAWHACGC